MGSGRGGLHRGTWGSREGEELRARVAAAFEQFGGSLAGDAAAELAEALVRIASGESPEDVIPEPGEVAFDLALDALSSFVPGGPSVTGSLSAAAKARRNERMAKLAEEASKAAERTRELLQDESGYIRLSGRMKMSSAEYAIVNSDLNNMYHARLKGREKQRILIGEYVYTVHVHDFDDYTITGRRRIR